MGGGGGTFWIREGLWGEGYLHRVLKDELVNCVSDGEEQLV